MRQPRVSTGFNPRKRDRQKRRSRGAATGGLERSEEAGSLKPSAVSIVWPPTKVTAGSDWLGDNRETRSRYLQKRPFHTIVALAGTDKHGRDWNVHAK